MAVGDNGPYGETPEQKTFGCSMEDVYSSLREKLETVGAVITIEDCSQKGQYIGYKMHNTRAMALRNIMNVFVLLGKAEKTGKGKWKIK